MNSPPARLRRYSPQQPVICPLITQVLDEIFFARVASLAPFAARKDCVTRAAISTVFKTEDSRRRKESRAVAAAPVGATAPIAVAVTTSSGVAVPLSLPTNAHVADDYHDGSRSSASRLVFPVSIGDEPPREIASDGNVHASPVLAAPSHPAPPLQRAHVTVSLAQVEAAFDPPPPAHELFVRSNFFVRLSESEVQILP